MGRRCGGGVRGWIEQIKRRVWGEGGWDEWEDVMKTYCEHCRVTFHEMNVAMSNKSVEAKVCGSAEESHEMRRGGEADAVYM
jgi:hypothetical protein